MAIFGPKLWVYPFETFCLYSLERRFFVPEYRKGHFPGLYSPPPKKVGRIAIFRPKPCVNPFGKMSNFRLLWTFCFYRLGRRCFVLKYRKRHFPGLYCPKKNLEKLPFLNNNHEFTPLENVNFSTFKSFCFYKLERRFFLLEYRKRHFPGLYCLKKKVGKWPFLHQNHGLNPLQKCQFFDFLNFLFL